MFFFVKQKTAYDMRISDCSSDVCSSDLLPLSPLCHELVIILVSVAILILVMFKTDNQPTITINHEAKTTQVHTRACVCMHAYVIALLSAPSSHVMRASRD